MTVEAFTLLTPEQQLGTSYKEVAGNIYGISVQCGLLEKGKLPYWFSPIVNHVLAPSRRVLNNMRLKHQFVEQFLMTPEQLKNHNSNCLGDEFGNHYLTFYVFDDPTEVLDTGLLP